jgi:hypothetical protein
MWEVISHEWRKCRAGKRIFRNVASLLIPFFLAFPILANELGHDKKFKVAM